MTMNTRFFSLNEVFLRRRQLVLWPVAAASLLAAPLAGLIVGVIWIGVGALVYGLLQIFAAFKVRKLAS